MHRKPIGVCSNCGGTVSIHDGPWMGVDRPTPSCDNCGAHPSKTHLPVIEMESISTVTKKLLHS